MKKLVIFLAIIITILSLNKEEKVTIPKEAIRFRIIGNSNNELDQELKREIVQNLSKELVLSDNITIYIAPNKYVVLTVNTLSIDIVTNAITTNNIALINVSIEDIFECKWTLYLILIKIKTASIIKGIKIHITKLYLFTSFSFNIYLLKFLQYKLR